MPEKKVQIVMAVGRYVMDSIIDSREEDLSKAP